MQAFAPRSYSTPARDEEAESERKAKSRQVRQTRRSTQGVTLTELREAQTTYSLPHQSREKEEVTLENKSCPWGSSAKARAEKNELSRTTAEIKQMETETDKEGNFEHQFKTRTSNPSNFSEYESLNASICNNYFKDIQKCWTDENENPMVDTTHERSSVRNIQTRLFRDSEDPRHSKEHDRLSRYDSSGESAVEKALGRAGSYTRRETRLAALNRQEQDSAAKDYKKMYSEALEENGRLKSKLQDSKQELAKIRSQLDKLQRHDRKSERTPLLESEKREKQALEKRVSDMEEEIKVLTELKSDNQRLKDENGALIRVISKLSK